MVYLFKSKWVGVSYTDNSVLSQTQRYNVLKTKNVTKKDKYMIRETYTSYDNPYYTL